MHGIADVAVVLLVVSVVLLRFGDELAINGVLLLELGSNDDGFVHLIAYDNPLTGLS